MGVPLVAGRLWSPDLSLILSWLPLQLILWLLLSAVTACRSTMWSRLPLGQLPLGSACCQPVASAPRGSAHVYGRGVWLRATPCPMTALTSRNWTTVRFSFRSTPPPCSRSGGMTPPGGPSSGSMCLLSFFVPSFFFFVQVLGLWGLSFRTQKGRF